MTDFYEMRKRLAENIRTNRIRLGLTQFALGKIVTNGGSGSVGLWEAEKCVPNAYSLCVLADLFECTVDELLGRA